ncbi:unnamed protein product [Didymodactylos carnosus]|uniref:Uncharacterized protein n=1 Tax=Didymodactylos carnosus TaxID=1234261 RepID=A0A8S2QT60_9BILA|nr:unnamed protein product [Didymodactylos carnosus]CAF4119251.1 unnamed protein product [Didymodactylos carnosus]
MVRTIVHTTSSNHLKHSQLNIIDNRSFISSFMLDKQWNKTNQIFKEKNFNTMMLSLLSDQNNDNSDYKSSSSSSSSPFLFEYTFKKSSSTSSTFYDLLTKNFTNYYQNVDNKINENNNNLENVNNDDQFMDNDSINKKKYRNSWPTMLNKQSTIASLSKSFDILNKLNTTLYNQKSNDNNNTKLTYTKYKRPLPWFPNDKINPLPSSNTCQFANTVISNKARETKIMNTSLSSDLTQQKGII